MGTRAIGVIAVLFSLGSLVLLGILVWMIEGAIYGDYDEQKIASRIGLIVLGPFIFLVLVGTAAVWIEFRSRLRRTRNIE